MTINAMSALPIVSDLLKAALPVVGDVVKAIAPLLQPFADAAARKIAGESTDSTSAPVNFASSPAEAKQTITFNL
jgi:uncharacterized membrane protein